MLWRANGPKMNALLFLDNNPQLFKIALSSERLSVGVRLAHQIAWEENKHAS
jgi:hypothetical protein